MTKHSKFVWSKDDVPQLFASVKAVEKAQRDELIAVAAEYGFNSVQSAESETLCGKVGTAQLVVIMSGGQWEYRDAETDERESGQGVVMLRWCLEGT